MYFSSFASWRVGVLFAIFCNVHFANTIDCTQSFTGLREEYQFGIVPETEPTQAVVIGQTDYHFPRMVANAQILESLPEDVSAIVLTTAGNPYRKDFSADFDTGRYKLIVDQVKSEGGLRDYSSWVRDFFPEVVRKEDGSLEMVSFQYYYPGANQQWHLISEHFNIPAVKLDLHLEGGNIMVDGSGRIFLTTVVMKRNPDLSRDQIEAMLLKHLVAREIHWLPPLPEEPTGHVDMMAKYVGANRMLVSQSRDPEKQRVLEEVATKLHSMGYVVYRATNAGGHEDPLVRSYSNSLIVNGNALVPFYENRNYNNSDYERNENKVLRQDDEAAQELYRDLGFCVRPVEAASMIYFQGSTHCMTKQIPTLPNLHFKVKSESSVEEDPFSLNRKKNNSYPGDSVLH